MFTLISDYEESYRRDLPVIAGTGDAAGHQPLNPNDARALIIGEWLELDDTNGVWSFVRGGTNVVGGLPAAPQPSASHAFPFFMERGRYDMQGIAGGGKGTVLYGGFYEFETDLTLDFAVGVPAIGDPLAVIDIDYEGAGVVRRGLCSIGEANFVALGLTYPLDYQVVGRVTFVDATLERIRAVRVYS
jgi:hypothetical protein